MVTDTLSAREIVDALWPTVTRRTGDRAVSATDLLDRLIRALGRIQRREHQLLAGDRILNDDREIANTVARVSSLGVCIYLGNRRIACAGSLDSGAPPEIGGFAEAELVDTVLRRRQTYRGVLEIRGRKLLVAARPLEATDSSAEHGAIGMVEAYQDLETLRDLLESGLREKLGDSTHSVIDKQADRMESVMRTIDDVARRLQLLALNGNIIAAQAGDSGRAFRVVCRELSNLADQSKDAVADVRRLVQEIGLAPRSPSTDEAELSVPLPPAEPDA